MRKFLIVFTLFIAAGAVGGAIMMWVEFGAAVVAITRNRTGSCCNYNRH